MNDLKTATVINLDDLPALPIDDDGPVFVEPWQAQAFAIVLELVNAGEFSWSEWACALGNELQNAEDSGSPDDGSHYYHHWVAALEGLVAEKQLVGKERLNQRKNDWESAFKNTPHGKPVVLDGD